MNNQIESIIQAEIDGTATPKEIALLDEATSTDPVVRASRAEHAEIARAVGRMASPVVPHGFTDRVMAALPPPVRARIPAIERLRSFVEGIVPSPRHQVALAFALGVLVTFMVTVTITDFAQPDTDLVSGTIKAPSGTTVPLSRDAGVLETAWIDGIPNIAVRPRESMALRVVISGSSGEPPAVVVDVADGVLVVQRNGADVELATERAGLVRFSVRGDSAFRVRVESGGEELVVWSSDTADR